MTVVKVSSKGWVVIPSDLRRKYALQAGAHVMLVDYVGVLAIVPTLERAVEQTEGMLKGGGSLVRALAAGRARERA